MTTCTTGDDHDCVARVDTAERFIRNDLPGRLDALYGTVRDRTRAKVVVLGYPRLFSFETRCALSEPKRRAVNRAADVCADRPWLNGLVLSSVDRSYHPNRTGQQSGYLPALTGAAS